MFRIVVKARSADLHGGPDEIIVFWDSNILFWDSKWGHGGPTLDAGSMRRLGELEISLWFDVYFSEPNREPEEVEGHPGIFRISF